MTHAESGLSDETAARGFIFHDDPDRLVALSYGFHDYGTIDAAKQAYVEGELSRLEFEAVVDGMLDSSFRE